MDSLEIVHWIPFETTLLSVRRMLLHLAIHKSRGDFVYLTEIKQQYRMLARACHPDKTLNNDLSAIQTINATYCSLCSLFKDTDCIRFDHAPRRNLTDDLGASIRTLLANPELIHSLINFIIGFTSK